MPTNLTSSTIASTFGQLLHIDGGPAGTEKIVYSATGVATALKLGTTSASVGNIRLSGNVISAVSGVLTLGAAIGFENAVAARTAMGLGTLATQAANNVNITGGTVTGVSYTGTVPFNNIINLAYASFYDAGTTDQTGSTTARTAVKWATAAITGAGITVASNSRITLTAAGTYRVNASLQFVNNVNAVVTVDFWFAKNGTNIASSAGRLTVPKSSEGGTNILAFEIFETVAAGDYLELYWHPSNVSARLYYIAPLAEIVGTQPAIPAVPPAIVVVQRIA
jgi:hypothetical protein